MNEHFNEQNLCSLIIKFGKAIFLNYNNSDCSKIVRDKNKFRCFKYCNNTLVEKKFITITELINLMTEYDITYINNVIYRLLN